MSIKKIIIGTAQFGLKYGIGNSNEKVAAKSIEKILSFANKNGIDTLDTAPSYGDAEKILGRIGVSNWKVQTKIKIDKNNESKISENIKNQIETSMNNLRISNFYSLLLHDENQLINEDKFEVYDCLLNLKKNGYINNFGVSFYNPDRLIETSKNFKFDFAQVPINVFDVRFLSYLDQFHSRIKSFQARSIFLQGLLLLDKLERPIKFKKWDSNFCKFEEWNVKNKISPLESCINFINNINKVENIIFGIRNDIELSEILDIFRRDSDKFTKECFVDDQDLINPINWDRL